MFISRADLARLGEIPANAPLVVYCAVDLQSHRPGSGAMQKLIVSISHLTADNVRRKMLLESINAFAIFHRSHPEYRYVIAGVHGNAVDRVRQHIAALNLNDVIELPGRVSFERKVELLQSATAYLQPSRCEGFGLAILEAAACGCPVVTNREACIREINAEAVLYGDTEDELATQLALLADTPELREEMRDRGLANVQRFSFEARRDALRFVLQSIGAFGNTASAPDASASRPERS